MAELEANLNVGEIVALHPGTSRVFERFGIDFCCGGRKPLGAACAAKGLAVGDVLGALEAELAEESGDEETSVADEPLAAITRYVVERFHVPLREELRRLSRLGERVVQVHGEDHPELTGIAATFARLRGELEAHMDVEESVLFPAIEHVEMEGSSFAGPPLEIPVGAMEEEHLEAAQALGRIRELASDYRPPAGACNTFLAFYDGLARFEAEMHRHIHLENEVLFPRAVALAGARAESPRPGGR